MSIQAMSWVLDHSPTKGADRLVLLSLANHASKEQVNGAWECWPGVATICREAGLERPRTVQECLARLEAAGAIERVINGAPDKRIHPSRKPNLYRIHGVSVSVTPGQGWGDGSRQGGVSDTDHVGCREASPKPSLNRQRTAPAEGSVPLERSTHPAVREQRRREASDGGVEPVASQEAVRAAADEARRLLDIARGAQ
jgi:hypothetical protein